MSTGDDTKLMRQMRGWADQTEHFYRDVAAQIDNKQLAQVLLNCANDRAAIIERLDEVIAELGGSATDESVERCCDREEFRMAANEDFGTLLERLADCDMNIRDRFAEMLDGADIKASTHLIADEAQLLLEHTAKKLRRIVTQARNATFAAALEAE